MAGTALIASGLLVLSQALTVYKEDAGYGGLNETVDKYVANDPSVVDSTQVTNVIRNSSVPSAVAQLAASSLQSFTIDVSYNVLVKEFEEASFTLTLARGGAMVLNASVIATFELPGNPVSTLRLVDQGLGVDRRAGDGTYSGLFSKFVGRGRYSVNFYASGTQDSVVVEYYALRNAQLRAKPKKDARNKVRSWIPDHELANSEAVSLLHGFELAQRTLAPTGPFTVNKTRRSMLVNADLFERDVPPAHVDRFKISSTEGVHTDGRRTWTLTWFNGGDHGYDGTAASLELRYSTDRGKISRAFSSCDMVDPVTDVLNGSLVPQAAYTAQTVEIVVPRSLTQELQNKGVKALSVYFNIRTTSSNGIMGEGFPFPAHKLLCPGTGPCVPSYGDDDDKDIKTVKPATTKPDSTQTTGTESAASASAPTQAEFTTPTELSNSAGTAEPDSTLSTETHSTTLMWTPTEAESTTDTERLVALSTPRIPPAQTSAKQSGSLDPATTTPRPSTVKEPPSGQKEDSNSAESAEELGGSSSNFPYVVALFSAVIIVMASCLGCAIALAGRKQQSGDEQAESY